MTGIKDLKNKESDRIKEIVENLKKFGFSVKSTINSISIDSNRKYYRYRGRSYCCRNCVESHRRIGYANLYYDSTAEYADL